MGGTSSAQKTTSSSVTSVTSPNRPLRRWRIQAPGRRRSVVTRALIHPFGVLRLVIHDFALALYSAWILSRPSEKRDEMPEDLLDRALKTSVEQGAFKPWGSRLHFVVGPVRLVCVELPDILRTAYFACVTDQLGERVARVFVRRLGLDEGEVRAWGVTLRAALSEEEQLARTYSAGR